MADGFADDTLVERSPAALSRRTLAGVLVLAPEMPEALQLSAPGDAIWEMLGEPLTVSELLNGLSAHYDEPPDTIRAHVLTVLDALFDGGAVRVAAAPGDHRD